MIANGIMRNRGMVFYYHKREEKVMKCLQCGQINVEGAKFCTSCGASLKVQLDSENVETEKKSEQEKKKQIVPRVIIYVIVFIIGMILLMAINKKMKYNITEEKVIEDFLAAASSEGGFTEKTGISISDADIVTEKTTDDTNYLKVILYGEKDEPYTSYEIKLDMRYHLYKQGWILDDDFEIEDVTATPHEGPDDDSVLAYVKENPVEYLDAKDVESDSVSGECIGEYLELEEEGDSRNYCQKHINVTVDYEYVTLQATVCVNYVFYPGNKGGGGYGSWQVDDIFIARDEPLTYTIKADKDVIGHTFTDPYGHRDPVTINSISEDMTTANITYGGITEDVDVTWSNYSEKWTLYDISLGIMIDFSPYDGVTVEW